MFAYPSPMKFLRLMGRGLLVIVALSACVYGVAVAINWKDQPPSATVQAFLEYHDARPAVAGADNAWYFLMGFHVRPDIDPLTAGQARQAWIAEQDPRKEIDYESEPYSDLFDFRRERTGAIADIGQACGLRLANCVQIIEGEPELAVQWLAEEAWVLDRYRDLLSLPDYQEPVPVILWAPLPEMPRVFDGQRLLLISAWLDAKAGDTDAVFAALDADLEFWRRAQVRSDSLISKMVATVAIRRNFSTGNDVLRALPPGTAVPESWQTPFDAEEISTRRVFIAEWFFSDSVVQPQSQAFSNPLNRDFDGESIGESIAWTLLRPFWQAQDLSNRRAEVLRQLIELSPNDYESVPDAYEAMMDVKDDVPDSRNRLYNFAGNLLLADHDETNKLGNYVVRITDLEGMRRAAVATAELRAAGVPAEDAGRHLAESTHVNPYSGEPFTWDESDGSVVFQGLQRGGWGEFRLRY